jgi:REP element-mobilizing transposase RayT
VRPFHHERHPLHVTMRVAQGLPSLRAQGLLAAARRVMARASREWFRLLHFSVQSNHLHLIVEARDRTGVSRGMAGLAIRLARAINGALGRTGRVFGDRYHARALASSREVRRAIVYVLMNHAKHASGAARVDRATSAFWFEGWRVRPRMRAPPGWKADDLTPVAPPRTWLARVGWRRHGLIGSGERPAPRRTPSVGSSSQV